MVDFEVDLFVSLDHAQPTLHSEPLTVHPLSHFVAYDKFSASHKAFLASITSRDEPIYFHQANKDPIWCEAKKKKIKALEDNDTWTLTNLPPRKRVIDSKLVYKIKYRSNDDFECYKPRLVTKSFTQIEGIIFH